MSTAERAVCARVKQIRVDLNWPQPAFASELDISLNRLASVEYARTPLRYDLAKRICDRFNISVWWLATGQGEQVGHIQIAEEVEQKIPIGALLKDAFEGFIRPKIGKLASRVLSEGAAKGIHLQLTSPVGLPPDRFREWMLLQEVRRAVKITPENLRPALADSVTAAISSFLSAHSAILEKTTQTEKQLLTLKSNFRNTPTEMKLTLSGLLDKVRKLTKPVGMKARLAADLSVPPSRVSEWLSGKHDPSGEVTLQLLAWVQQQERSK